MSRRAFPLSGHAGFLKNHCLLNACPVFCRLAPSGSECESKIAVPSMEQKRCCTENTAVFAHWHDQRRQQFMPNQIPRCCRSRPWSGSAKVVLREPLRNACWRNDTWAWWSGATSTGRRSWRAASPFMMLRCLSRPSRLEIAGSPLFGKRFTLGSGPASPSATG